jgi:hypothetical protein
MTAYGLAFRTMHSERHGVCVAIEENDIAASPKMPPNPGESSFLWKLAVLHTRAVS